MKLARPRGMPRKRLVEWLEQARRDCNRARNAAVMHWYRWRRDHPDWQPGDPYEAPKARIKRPSKPGAKVPKDGPLGPRLFLSRELYAAATAAAPMLSTNVASSCVQEVLAKLKSNVPYNHDGQARYFWEALLGNEINLPTWRGGRIPTPRRCMQLVYDDHQCTLRFSLLSQRSGFAMLSPTVNLDAGDLARGNRRLLRALANGMQRLADSAIVEAKGKWFARLCYEVPATASGLDAGRVMELLPALPDNGWPFLLRWSEEEKTKLWKVGKARPMVAEYRRVVARRRAIRYRYSDGCGKGHGRQRWYKSIRPMERTVRDMQERFAKQTIADIVALAIRQGCGKLLYLEPTMPVRDHGWFAQQDVPFGWAEFEARLKFKAECAGLAYEKQRIGMNEWRPKDEHVKTA